MVFRLSGAGQRLTWSVGGTEEEEGGCTGACSFASVSCRKRRVSDKALVLSADTPGNSTQEVTATFATNAGTCCVASQNAASAAGPKYLNASD